MDSTFSRFLRVYSILRRAHGVYVIPFFLGFVFLGLRMTVAFYMWLDGLFFSRLKTTQAERPIVLVGNHVIPRSGLQ